MKKILTLVVISSALLTTGCVYRKIAYPVSFVQKAHYEVNNVGAFDEEWKFDPNDFLSDLDISAETGVDSVYISSFSLKAKALEGNTATGINILGTFDDKTTDESRNLFSNNFFDLDESGEMSESVIENLSPLAVKNMKSIITNRML